MIRSCVPGTCIVVALAGLGCGGYAQTPDGAFSPAEVRWTRAVYGATVLDEAGREIAHPFLGGFNLPRPQLADADGDGDLDLFVQEVAGKVMYFENADGSGTPEGYRWRSDFFAGLDVGEWYRFVDVDLDGDLDLLAEEPYSHIRFYRNDADAAQRYVLAADTLRDVSGEPIFSDRQNIPNAADIDCDGNLDLLIGRLTGTISRYEAGTLDEAAAPRFRHVTDSFEGIEIVAAFQGSLHGANTMALGDVDQDGDADLFWGDFFEAGLLFIENTGSCETLRMRGGPRPFPLDDPIATSGYNAPALGDVDGDGDMDLVMGVLGGAFDPKRTAVENLYLIRQEGRGDFRVATRRLISMIDVGDESLPVFHDVDGDGDHDLLLANKIETDRNDTGRVRLFENVSSPGAPRYEGRGVLDVFPDGFHPAPAFGDLDGDGMDELVMGGWEDEIALYESFGDGFDWRLADSAWVKLTRGRNAVPALGDVDSDGDLDLFVGEASGTLNYYRNDGNGSAPRFVLVSDRLGEIDVGRRSAPALRDMDGDGDLDLVVGSELEGIQLFMNEGVREGAPVFSAPSPLPVVAPALSTPAFSDIDGDGVMDLAIGGRGGGLAIFLAKTGNE